MSRKRTAYLTWNFPPFGKKREKDGAPSAGDLLAQAELRDHSLIALGIVGFQVVEQATPLADQHEKAAARTVVFQVHFEMFRQLTNALA
jgi:hypothetical protein